MAAITVKAADLPALRMPPVCARTGARASDSATLRVRRRGRRVAVVLPYAEVVMRRYRVLYGAMLALLLPTMVFGLAAVFERDPRHRVVIAVLVCCIAALTYVRETWLVRGRWAGDDTIELSRLHPAFVAALRAAYEPAAFGGRAAG